MIQMFNPRLKNFTKALVRKEKILVRDFKKISRRFSRYLGLKFSESCFRLLVATEKFVCLSNFDTSIAVILPKI